MIPGLLMILTGPLIIAPPAPRVGQVFTIGGDVVPHDIILDRLGLVCGQPIADVDMKKANRRLSWLRLLGVRADARIMEEAHESQYKSIRVQIEDTALTRLLASGPRVCGEARVWWWIRMAEGTLVEYVFATDPYANARELAATWLRMPAEARIMETLHLIDLISILSR